MMKKVLKSILMALLVVSSIVPMNVKALNIYITPDKYEAEVDQKITYKVKIEDIESETTINVDGQEVTFTKEDNEKTFERSYVAAGDYRFQVSLDDNTFDYVVVKIVEEGSLENTTPDPDTENPNQNPQTTTKGKEAKLNSLVVKDSEGKSIPLGFSSSTMDYEIDLTDEHKEIEIITTPVDEEHAKVQGDGVKTIVAGENKFEIIVTAEDGETKLTYTVYVNVKATPVTSLEFNGKDYGLMAELTNVETPNGFKKTKTTINGKNVGIFTNGDILLVYGYGQDGTGDYYVYREEDGIIASYKPLTVGNQTIYLIDVPNDEQQRSNMTFKTIQISDTIVDAWTFNDSQLVDYSLIYALNNKCEEDFFVYDGKNQQLLEYPDNEPTTAEDFDKWLTQEDKEKPNYVLYGSIGIGAIAVVAIVLWVFKGNKDDEEIEEVESGGTKEFVFSEKKKEKPVVKPVEKVDTQEDDDDQWLTDHFYQTILGEDDE